MVSKNHFPFPNTNLLFQPNRNLPPIFQKSQLNLLYELNQKHNFILQKFQTCFWPLIQLAFPFPKPACSGSVAALVSSENPQKVLSLVSVMYFNSNLPSNTIFLFLIDWCGVRLTWLIVFFILQLLGLFDFIASPSPSFAIFDSSIVRPLFLVTCSEITDFGFLFLFFSLCVCILVNSSYGLHE